MRKAYISPLRCSVDGCEKFGAGGGLCGMHRSRLRRHGSTSTAKCRRYNGAKCLIDGCKKPAEENYLCGMHMQRIHRYGDPYYVTPDEVRNRNNRAAQPRTGTAKPSTYLKFHGRHEHRIVAEKELGRELTAGEIVHHIDGDKHNNVPKNLRVMSQSDHMKEHCGDLVAGKRKAAKC